MSKAASTIHPHHKPSSSNLIFGKAYWKEPLPGIEIVGTKTHEELASSWLVEFKKTAPITGRPKGGLTSEEMAEKAQSTRYVVEDYIRKNPKLFTRVMGTYQYPSGNRRKTYYVYNGR